MLEIGTKLILNEDGVEMFKMNTSRNPEVGDVAVVVEECRNEIPFCCLEKDYIDDITYKEMKDDYFVSLIISGSFVHAEVQ